MNDTPNFHTWQYVNLANFATDAYLRLQLQQIEIELLKLKLLGTDHAREEDRTSSQEVRRVKGMDH
jgi:hypothetical protein